jgi:hydrogenase nickel incorporation protein HypA/HybF
MHELPITKSIFLIVLRHARANNVKKVISVNLEIGALSDVQDEWVQRYFDHLTRGTVVEGAKLKTSRVPAVFRCNDCQEQFEVNSLLEGDLTCARCHSRSATLVSGREYHIKSMEAQ